MATALVGALAALIGIILGQVLVRSSEYKKWLRTEQHTACAALLDVAETIRLYHRIEQSIDESLLKKANNMDFKHDPTLRQVFKSALEQTLLQGSQPGRPLTDQELDEYIERLYDNQDGPLRTKLGIALIGARRPNVEEYLATLRESAERITLAGHKVRLICPLAIVKAADKLTSAASELMGPHNDESERTEQFTAYLTARRTFVEKARTLLYRESDGLPVF